MKKIKKIRFIYTFLLSCAGLLLTGFIVRIIADRVKYNPISSSAPFGVMILLRAFEFLIPASGFLTAGLTIREKSGDGKAAREKRKEKRKGKRKKNIIAVTAAVLAVIIFLLTLGGTIGLSVFLNRHIDYKGEADAKHPLQGVWKGEDFGLSEEILTLETSDGEELWCSEITAENPKAVVIFLTGIEQPSVTYFYPHAKILLDEGISSFLLEVRSHGRSSGRKIGLGYTEPNDVRALVDYISEKEIYDGVPVILWGVSMGGAAVLNSFGEISEVDACIAMSAYASFEDELDLSMKKRNIPEFLRKFELIFLKWALYLNYGKETVKNLTPENSIQKANGRPVALIACSGDTSVPVENTELLKKANPDAEVWIRDSWEHFIIRDCDFKNVRNDTEYLEFTLNFIKNVIE